jgi:thiol-disulfide isomerase/thioredoxin
MSRITRRTCLVAGLGALGVASARAEAGAPASSFDWPPLRLLDGQTLAPASWQGQGAVVVFWETHCPFCKRHNARLDKLHRATRGQPLRVLGVALDTDEQVVRHYMAANDFRFPVTLDGTHLRARWTARRVIPMTLVFDRQGRLLQAIPGEMSEDDVLGLPGVAARGAG